jgi:5-methylcytosine-specific restriction endonuclease McrA
MNSEVPDRPCVDRPATPQEIEAGRKLAHELRDRYNVRRILVAAAEAGCITELRCAMPYCFASARDHFVPHGLPLGPWMPTHEHFPLAKRFKGTRTITNAILAHRRCNNVGYKIEDLSEYLQQLRLPDGSALHPDAVATAIKDHIEQRVAGQGRYPRRSGSRKRAIRIAHETHQLLD